MIKITSIDRLNFLVKDLEEGARFFGDLLNLEWRYLENRKNDIKGVLSPPGVSLSAPLTPEGPVARYLAKKGEGISMITFEVENIQDAIKHFRARHIREVGECLFHPEDTYGVMIELVPSERALRWRRGTYAGAAVAPPPSFSYRKDNIIRVTSLHHVNFLVKDIDEAGKFLGDVLGFEWRRTGNNVPNDYKGLRSKVGISLITPLTLVGPVDRNLAKKGEGISIVMLAGAHSKVAWERFKSRGVRRVGLGLSHPRDTHYVSIEMTENSLAQMWERGLPMLTPPYPCYPE